MLLLEMGQGTALVWQEVMSGLSLTGERAQSSLKGSDPAGQGRGKGEQVLWWVQLERMYIRGL